MTDDKQPPTCGGEPMEWNVMARRWECSCGRDVADELLCESAVEARAFEHWRWPMTFFRVDPSTPVRVEIATAGGVPIALATLGDITE